MNKKNNIFLFVLIAVVIASCSAPQIDEDFLNEEYYTNTVKHNQQNGSFKLQTKVDSLILELNRVQFRLLQMQLDYLTLSNNMMNLQLHAAELKLMQHIKEHELMTMKDNSKDERLTNNVPVDMKDSASFRNINSTNKDNVELNNDPIYKRSDEEKAVDKIEKRRTLIFDNIYEEGVLLFNGRKYNEAVEKFDALFKLDMKDSSLVDNSYYWLGECYFALGDYTTAISNFKKVIEIKESNKNADALVMLGQAYEKLEWKELARDIYSKFIEAYPKDKNIPFAKARLKSLF